jgi:Cu/Ag efflux protein CusF
VLALDKTAQKIRIAHGPVPSMNWPGMDMVFAVASADLLADVNSGDKVRFDFSAEGNVYTVVDIETIN